MHYRHQQNQTKPLKIKMRKKEVKKNEAITAVEVNPTHLIRPSNGPCSSHTANEKIRISRKMQIDRSLIHPYLTSVPLLIS